MYYVTNAYVFFINVERTCEPLPKSRRAADIIDDNVDGLIHRIKADDGLITQLRAIQPGTASDWLGDFVVYMLFLVKILRVLVTVISKIYRNMHVTLVLHSLIFCPSPMFWTM